jgi:hypothetical protein
MEMTPKKANKYATILFVSWIVAFFALAYLILEPIQLHYANNAKPDKVPLVLLTLLWAFITAYATFTAFSLSTLSYQKWTTTEEFTWGMPLGIRNFWVWFVCWSIPLIGAALWWRGEL